MIQLQEAILGCCLLKSHLFAQEIMGQLSSDYFSFIKRYGIFMAMQYLVNHEMNIDQVLVLTVLSQDENYIETDLQLREWEKYLYLLANNTLSCSHIKDYVKALLQYGKRSIK